jgi:hypothetical protein
MDHFSRELVERREVATGRRCCAATGRDKLGP